MLHNTKAIILRTTKYAETSIIATMYTQLFGIQSYLVNGIRKSNKHGGTSANLFMPAQILQLQVLHQEAKSLQRIKDFQAAYIYTTLQNSMVKNAIAIYCIELISKCIHEPESNEDLYDFFEKIVLYIDSSEEKLLTNLPIYFSLQLANNLGYQLQGNFSKATPILNLQEGEFVPFFINEAYCCTEKISEIISALNQKSMTEMHSIAVTNTDRHLALQQAISYLQIHIPNMQTLKSPAVLHAVFS